MRLLAIGPLWRGSNAGGLFRALGRQGCLMEIVDEFYYISMKSPNKVGKIFQRIVRPRQTEEYNNVIKNNIEVFKPDVFFVYKGAFVKPSTLEFAKDKGCKLVMFYPDVSLTNHGTNIPQSIPLYDIIFTTKTFGISDIKSKFGVNKTFFIPHGFDPEIHRKLNIGSDEAAIFGCDVSFIGTWSLKKEKWLAHLIESLPQASIKIWGDQWKKATSAILKPAIQGRAILGDLYAIAIQCSKINLGILSEQVAGASSGDLITSRTFHIPGASGFMLHERNEESVQYFRENEEAGFFDGPEELVIKVKEYLANDALREQIREAGYKRAMAEDTLDQRAKVIIEQMNALK